MKTKTAPKMKAKVAKATKKKPSKAKATKKPAAKKAAKKSTPKKAKAKKPTSRTSKAAGFAIHEGGVGKEPITERDVIETPPPQLRVLDGNPIKAGKRVAYVAVIEDGKYKLGIAAEGEAGYYRIDDTSDAGAPFATHAEATACADVYNERLGLTKLQASEIVLSSIGEQNKAKAAEADNDDDESSGDESSETADVETESEASDTP